jgi:Flp pilus assembly pilin Flp
MRRFGFLTRARGGVRRFHRDRRGIEALEYLMLACLVMLAGFAAWRYLGNRLNESVIRFTQASSSCTADALNKGGF